MCKAPHFILLPWEFCPNTRVWGLAGNGLGLQSPVFYQLPVWDLRSSNAFQIHPFSRSPLRTTPAAIPAALPIHWVFFGGRTSLGQTPYNQVDCLKSDSYFSRVPHFLAHLQEKKKTTLTGFSPPWVDFLVWKRLEGYQMLKPFLRISKPVLDFLI